MPDLNNLTIQTTVFFVAVFVLGVFNAEARYGVLCIWLRIANTKIPARNVFHPQWNTKTNVTLVLS
jgi:hypothetical protein